MPARETVSDVFLETLRELGIRYIFANLGTDYAPIVETIAKYRDEGLPLPEILLCPHENTAITAAHGYALATGQGQGVFVHVGVGTQNLGGALQNAWSARVPMLIFAGRTPLSTRGERLGGRDNPIHYFQDVRDQAGIIRQYCKWEFTLELPEQVGYALQRGVRLMQSEPKGAIYVTAAREVLAMPVGEMISDSPERCSPAVLGELPEEAAARLAEALWRAERPLIVTTYLGRHLESVPHLVALSEALKIPVVETVPTHLNFPRDHAHHWGFLGERVVGEADFVLLLDTDVPWMAKHAAPGRDVPVVQLDVDPVKAHITMWDFPVTESHWVETRAALPKIVECVKGLPKWAPARAKARQEWLDSKRLEPPPPMREGKLTVQSLSMFLGEALGPEVVIFDEGVSNSNPIRRFTRRTRPGSYFGLPGGSLGWGGGAALGYKLARPEAEVVWLVGDGSFFFSVPSSLYMTAMRYRVPFLTVIINNQAWNAVKVATDRVYGTTGIAARTGQYLHELAPTGHLEQVAGAFGCFAVEVDSLDALREAFNEGRKAVAAGRPAVINALLSAD